MVALIKQQYPAARLPHPGFAAVIAALASGLPDVLERANSPHHRQTCHSAAFAALVTSGLKKLHDWVPATPGEALMRDGLLGVGFDYMAHLCADATTARGLPLVGNVC